MIGGQAKKKNRWSGCTDSCHGEAAAFVIGCAVDPKQFPVVCLICLSELLRSLRLAKIDRHVSLLHAKRK